MEHEKNAVALLFQKFSGREADKIEALPPSGSYRKYFRLFSNNNTFIGAYNEDKKENIAFLSFTNHFFKLGLHVPQVLAEDLEHHCYLLNDLGDVTLLAYLSNGFEENGLSAADIDIYKEVLGQLPQIQVKGAENIDFSLAYPRHAFDKQSMMWDLNYFKYYFLKLARVPFDEQKLEDDFQAFTEYLLKADCNFFLYRDFQSRNIMIINDKPYFIDYQGGRKGALQYDVASVLFESKTQIPPETRDMLLEHYLTALSTVYPVDKEQFMRYYYGYVYIRLMQAMGAYGFRGLYEKKELFLQSIPKAIEHLKWLRTHVSLPVAMPELEHVWDHLVTSTYIQRLANKGMNMTVHINSFSYKRGIPVDETQNGGGFVFDCRALNNPGRHDAYKMLTGKDESVKQFLNAEKEVHAFLNLVYELTDMSIHTYTSRSFNHLMISFGCTGGQHRSVFAAEQLAAHINNKFAGLHVIIRHRELEMKKS